MKVLIVEDDNDYVSEIAKHIDALNHHAKFTVAVSRDSAMSKIRNGFFDLIVLDLKLPTVDGSLDAEPEHGNAVFGLARNVLPGTPIFVLTGSSGEDFIGQLTAQVHQIDIWGLNRTLPTVEFLAKHKFENFDAKIGPYLADFNSIFEVELQKSAVTLSKEDDRLLRIFANRVKAVKCVVQRLKGGLSDVRVYRLKLTDAKGALIHDSVCKLGSRADVFDESSRFDAHVSRLEGSATPRKLDLLQYGAGGVCGVFYGLADGYDSDAFEVAMRNDGLAIDLVKNLQALTSRWRLGQPQTRKQIAEIRRILISDAKFGPVRSKIPFEWVEDFESKSVQVVEACVHGDSHGFNVLVAPVAIPILIDYGDVGIAPVSLDPITLELSLFFHLNGPLKQSDWPSAGQAEKWGDLDAYLVDCPAESFVRACRNWAQSVAAGNREIAAVAYSYLARQLKYEDVDLPRVLALMKGAKSFYDTAT
jgi:CheY-like chemotaxis protein